MPSFCSTPFAHFQPQSCFECSYASSCCCAAQNKQKTVTKYKKTVFKTVQGTRTSTLTTTVTIRRRRTTSARSTAPPFVPGIMTTTLGEAPKLLETVAGQVNQRSDSGHFIIRARADQRHLCPLCPLNVTLAKSNGNGSKYCCLLKGTATKTVDKTLSQTVTYFKTRTVTRTSTALVDPNSPASIYDTLRYIESGDILKEYQISYILGQINEFPKVKEALQGKNSGYPQLTFFASIDGGWPVPFLVKAPNNRSHSLGTRISTELNPENNLSDVLNYNILPLAFDFSVYPLQSAKVLAPTLLKYPMPLTRVDPQYLVMLLNKPGDFKVWASGYETQVIDKLICTNGVLYITVKLVIPPPWPTTMMNRMGLDLFAQKLADLELSDTFNSYGRPNQLGATFFVPFNEAMQIASENFFNSLDTFAQKDAMRYHVVTSLQGVYYSSDFEDGQALETVHGDTLTISIEDGTVFVNGVQLLFLDIVTSNGVVSWTRARQGRSFDSQIGF